jgi:hypothetical protein
MNRPDIQPLTRVILLIVLASILLPLCRPAPDQGSALPADPVDFTLEMAANLASLPLACLQQEYPNKLGQTLGGKEDLGEPGMLHPAFFGCFDWHSAVHGHWSLVWLLKNHPGFEGEAEARRILRENLSTENIAAEVAYFRGPHSQSYERTYGWAWLLKLAEEAGSWEDPLGREISDNLSPLADLLVERYLDFLPRLHYPIRVGEHTNTAFGLSFAWDYAVSSGHQDLQTLIEARAREFYMADSGCPLDWEPGGYDFLSPCLEEVDLMRRVLDEEEFFMWIETFLPGLRDPGFRLEVGIVSDRSDGKLVHLDGLNFSRAWVFYGLAEQYPAFEHLLGLGDRHLQYSLPNLVGDSYEGGHWLGSFALYALDSRP